MKEISPFNKLKIISHAEKIEQLLEGKIPSPVRVVLEPTNLCNHNCFFCCYSSFRNKNDVYLSREKLFELTMEEIPYSTAVVVENMAVREDGLMEVSATVFVERESQKGIVIGKKGSMLQKVGTAARNEMEEQLGRKVFLDLWVKVKKGWTDRDGLLREMGYE